MKPFASFLKTVALSILDQSKHRGHDLWRDMRFFRRQILGSSAPVLFDVGANVGQTAIAMAQAFPDAQIYSFEPCSNAFEQLKGNTVKFPKVEAVRNALGNQIQTRRIQIQEASTTNSLVRPIEDDQRAETIEIITVDSFAAEREVSRLFLLKTDTEGFDIEVLSGAKNLLATKAIDYILCETCFYRKMDLPQTDFGQVSLILSEFDYHLCHLYETVYATRGGSALWSNALYTWH